MKLTAFTDYSLRVLMYLAVDPQRRATISQIGQALDIKENHLTKVVHFLGKNGWIKTLRGKGGGAVLARPASDIVLGHVVRDTEGQVQPAACFSDDPRACALVRCCQLKDVLADAVRAFYGVLDHVTLADVTRNRRALAGILQIHAVR